LNHGRKLKNWTKRVHRFRKIGSPLSLGHSLAGGFQDLTFLFSKAMDSMSGDFFKDGIDCRAHEFGWRHVF
jgi:hypothetical protein